MSFKIDMNINQDSFRKIVSGEEQSWRARFLRVLLSSAEIAYALVAAFRNLLYDWKIISVTHVDVPVISIGNLTMGGTGKTPLSCALCQFLRRERGNPAIISRGYKAKPGEYNDEAKEVLRRLPGLIYVQNPDRTAAAKGLMARPDCNRPRVLVLDDGFQHRRMARDFDIVLLDAQNPFGYGRICPRGFLRESITGLKRADAVILTRADSISPTERERIQIEVRRWNPAVFWAEAVHRPARWQTLSGDERGLSELSGRRAFVFCGLGNPAAFRKTVEQAGVEIVDFAAFPDHHMFTVEQAKTILDEANQAQSTAVVCSMKDFVKWPLTEKETAETWGNDSPLFGLQIDFRFIPVEAVPPGVEAARVDTSGVDFWYVLERALGKESK